jgi:Gluconate 2-dehydrogenase subunit 3
MAIKMYLPPKGETRRGFLKKGLLGGALLSAGGLGWVALRPGRLEALPAGMLVLHQREYSVLMAVARRMLPSGGAWPTPERLEVGLRADHVIARLDETGRIELRQLLNVLESGLSGLLSGVSATPFTAMTAEQQDAVLKDWGQSRLLLKRSGFHALRGLVLAVYFGNPEAWASVGYGGPPPFHDPDAPVWKGGGQPRPPGLGVWVEPQ